jgi:hypothetical protein
MAAPIMFMVLRKWSSSWSSGFLSYVPGRTSWSGRQQAARSMEHLFATEVDEAVRYFSLMCSVPSQSSGTPDTMYFAAFCR